jgi:hypothetical protein
MSVMSRRRAFSTIAAASIGRGSVAKPEWECGSALLLAQRRPINADGMALVSEPAE